MENAAQHVHEGRTRAINVISDAICPWCYIGKRHLETAMAILADEGLRFEVSWHAYQLNPDMPTAGVDRRKYRIRKFGSWERSLELDARIAQAGAAVGLEFRTALMERTPNTLAAHRVIWLAGEHGVQDTVVEALFRTYFTEGKDIGEVAVLADVAASAGLDRPRVAAMLAGEEGQQIILAEDLSARRAGLNGVPTFVMDGHVLFSGAMPGATMAQAFRRAWTILDSRAA
jgi:predicted DsbA family dithiol-disulfide isomerase